jgi:two-component system sporulation sensor kinase A
VLGLTPRILQGANTDRTQLDKIRKALSSWEPIIIELINYRKDGSEFWVELSIVPVADESGQYTHWVSIQREITDRRLIEKMLRNSEKLNVVGELAAGVAHEIRNPLTSLRGFTQLLKFNPEANKKFLPLMISELDRIEYIVSEFLSLAKPSEDQFTRTSLLSLMQNIVLLLDIHAIMSNVQITLDIPDTMPLIYCEENRMKQVFLNIIKNGIESMEKGGTLIIKGEYQNEQLLIKFIDQGCGIPADIIANLGKPFYTTKEKGTGLGLMMCHQIIKSHNGQMHFESVINQGTTVFITLPIAK